MPIPSQLPSILPPGSFAERSSALRARRPFDRGDGLPHADGTFAPAAVHDHHAPDLMRESSMYGTATRDHAASDYFLHATPYRGTLASSVAEDSRDALTTTGYWGEPQLRTTNLATLQRKLAADYVEQQLEQAAALDQMRDSVDEYVETLRSTCPADRAVLKKALLEYAYPTADAYAYQHVGRFEDVLFLGTCQEHGLLPTTTIRPGEMDMREASATDADLHQGLGLDSHAHDMHAHDPQVHRAVAGHHMHGEHASDIPAGADASTSGASRLGGMIQTLGGLTGHAINAAGHGAAAVCQFARRPLDIALVGGAAAVVQFFAVGFLGNEAVQAGLATNRYMRDITAWFFEPAHEPAYPTLD